MRQVRLVTCLLSAAALAAQDPDRPQDNRRLETVEQELQSLREMFEEFQADSSERLDASEEQLIEVEDRIAGRPLVRTYDALGLRFGGFLTQTFSGVQGQETDVFSANQTLLELLVSADLTDDVSAFAAIGFLREADIDFTDPERPIVRNFANRVPLILGSVEWAPDERFRLQLGRFITPHGIINIEHFPPTLLEINQPQFLRPFSGATIFPNFTNGARIAGAFHLGDGVGSLEYDAYLGHFNLEPDSNVVGARVAFDSDLGFEAGVNYGHGRRAQGASALGSISVVGPLSLTSNEYDFVGADFLVDKGPVFWKTELFVTFEDQQEDRFAFYTQPAFRFSDEWSAFYRFDHFDPGQGLTSSTEHVVGCNYLPIPTIRLRGAVIFKEFEQTNDDAQIFQLTATFSF